MITRVAAGCKKAVQVDLIRFQNTFLRTTSLGVIPQQRRWRDKLAFIGRSTQYVRRLAWCGISAILNVSCINDAKDTLRSKSVSGHRRRTAVSCPTGCPTVKKDNAHTFYLENDRTTRKWKNTLFPTKSTDFYAFARVLAYLRHKLEAVVIMRHKLEDDRKESY